MNKNVKKIVSTLLVAGLLLGSIPALADTTDTTADTAVTATAETTTNETAAPVETTAPAVEDDYYYEEAIGLLTKMGIFTGYEDGSIKPESTITRAEMAAVILRTMDIKATSEYTGMFTDVDASHWAASTIQTAANAKIINGMGDGTFAPDKPVTYEQAVKMLVCAIGYDELAKGLGGYPTGYISVAGRKDIEVTKNVSGAVGENATRGTVAKLVYNALNALFPVAAGADISGVRYDTDEDITVASKLHDVYKYEGVVTATYATSIDPSITLTDGQVAIDGTVFERTDVDMEQYIGYKTTVYYTEYNKDGEKTIIYVVPNRKNETLVIDADDVESIKNINGSNGEIEYRYNESSSKTKKAKVSSPTIIYNGKKLYASHVPSGETMEDFIKPDVGTITLNDNNGDGKYDVIFVEKYETIVATSSTDKAVMGKYNTPTKVDLDNEDDDKLITIVKDGKEIVSKNVKKWDVLTMKRSVNTVGEQVIDIQVCNDKVEGKITDVDKDGDDIDVVIDGKKYEVDKQLAEKEDITVKTEGVFYLDVFGRIAGMDSTSSGKISGSEQYGWLIKAYKSDEEDAVLVKLFTQAGKVEVYEVADTMNFWGPAESDDLEKLDFSKNADVTKLLTAADKVKSNTVGGKQMGLVKYELNSKDELKTLVMPYLTTDEYSSDDISDRVVVYNADLDGTAGSGTMLGKKFAMQDGMIQFNVPEDVADIADTAAYSISTANATDYIYYDGISAAFAVAEFKGNKPNVVIRWSGSSTAAADFTYNSADDNGLIMVSKVQKVYDDASEEEVYKITGYSNGNKVEYTTTTTTSVAAATGISGGYTGFTGDTNRHYGTTPLWTAANKVPTYTTTDETTGVTTTNPVISVENQEKYTDLREVLSEGDIIGVSASGVKANIIIKMIDMSDYLDKPSSVVWGAYKQYSSTRDGLAFGKITKVDSDDTVVITTESGETYSFDPGAYVITYNVKDEDVDDDVTAADLIAYDDDEKEGDFVFLRMFKGGQREIFAIRFE